MWLDWSPIVTFLTEGSRRPLRSTADYLMPYVVTANVGRKASSPAFEPGKTDRIMLIPDSVFWLHQTISKSRSRHSGLTVGVIGPSIQ
jgi:hypothetical protein